MKQKEGEFMDASETEQTKIVIENIAPNGLGFGEGGISLRRQMELGILTPEVPKHIGEVLMHDPNAFKAVETDDDGCGDGRPWVKIIRMENGDGQKEVVEYKKSLLRAKVFGGGLVVAASMWRTINGRAENGETIIGDREFMINELASRNFKHGAHTDGHADGEKCGCGAIDNYAVITANAIKYRAQITDTLKALYGEAFDDNRDAIEETFDVYENIARDTRYFEGSNGKKSMEQILESGAVVKELYGHHVEDTKVLNEVDGTTLDQQYFTQKVKELSTDKPQTVQAFVVDIWRGRQIAQTVADIKVQHDPKADSERVYKVAMADFMIRTLAVAGTLTAGDLPVYRRTAA